jgi:hypothetical protein
MEILHSLLHGRPNPKIICSHCSKRGYVHTKRVSLKRGISGGKATAGLMTGGLSLFATGLSRKQPATEAWCANCRSLWQF